MSHFSLNYSHSAIHVDRRSNADESKLWKLLGPGGKVPCPSLRAVQFSLPRTMQDRR
jgi:hypothetical protein